MLIHVITLIALVDFFEKIYLSANVGASIFNIINCQCEAISYLKIKEKRLWQPSTSYLQLTGHINKAKDSPYQRFDCV